MMYVLERKIHNQVPTRPYWYMYIFYPNATLLNKVFIGSDYPGESMDQQNDSDMTGQPDGIYLDENSDWLHTNNSNLRETRRRLGTESTPTGKRRMLSHLSDVRRINPNNCYAR